MLEYGFEAIGLAEIFSVINPKNIRSIKIAKKLGLQYQRDVDWPNRGKVNLFMAKSQKINIITFKKLEQ